MSLVNEALKRARAEEAERAARRTGAPYPAGHPPSGPAPGARRRPVALYAILGVVFFLGIALGVSRYLGSNGSDRAGAGSAVDTAPSPGPGASPLPSETPRAARGLDSPTEETIEPPPRERANTPLARPVPPSSQSLVPPRAERPPVRMEPSPASDSSTERTAAAAPTPPDPAPRAAPESRATPRPEPRPPARSAPAPAADRGTELGSRNATAQDGRTFALGGIAWSDTGPFALVNGRVLAAGEQIAGFRIVEIQREWVRLEEGDEVIVLRLR